MDPYEELAAAIITKAVEDYRKALRIIRRNPRNRKAMVIINDCESFFSSQYFSALTEIDGGWLRDKLREEAINDGKGIS